MKLKIEKLSTKKKSFKLKASFLWKGRIEKSSQIGQENLSMPGMEEGVTIRAPTDSIIIKECYE